MGQKVTLDSVTVIYLFEQHPVYIESARRVFSDISRGRVTGMLSVIGLIEILTGPKKIACFDLALEYRERLTSHPHFMIMSVSEAIVDAASDFRARYNLHTPDAIHLATAYTEGALFVTNDKALKRVKEVEVVMINDYKKL